MNFLPIYIALIAIPVYWAIVFVCLAIKKNHPKKYKKRDGENE